MHARLVVCLKPTCFSNLASICSGLSDMRKSRVVSTQGAGPSFSGAYWTLRIIKRTELLMVGEGNKAHIIVEIYTKQWSALLHGLHEGTCSVF